MVKQTDLVKELFASLLVGNLVFFFLFDYRRLLALKILVMQQIRETYLDFIELFRCEIWCSKNYSLVLFDFVNAHAAIFHHWLPLSVLQKVELLEFRRNLQMTLDNHFQLAYQNFLVYVER